jgi:hypothetical protein
MGIWASGDLHIVILLLRPLSWPASAIRLGVIAAFIFLLVILFAFATGHNHVYDRPRPLKERYHHDQPDELILYC